MKLTTSELPSVEVYLAHVTPRVAADMLERNLRNRAIIKARKAYLVKQMKVGTFKFNGDTICFDKDGYCIDGQHRLQAIIDSGIPQTMIIVTGLDPKARHTIDIGALRSLSHAMKIEGIEYHSVFSAAATFIRCFLAGVAMPHHQTDGDRFSEYNTAIDFYWNNEEELVGMHKKALQFKTHKGIITPALMIAFMFYAKSIDKDADSYIYHFFEDLIDGTKNRPSNMPHLLRNRIYQEKGKRHALSKAKINELILTAIKKYKRKDSQSPPRIRSGNSPSDRYSPDPE
jgi:hypothetical protein